MLKLTHSQFILAQQFITTNNAYALLEVRMQQVWGAGSRPTIYTAVNKGSFLECSLTEKVILVEAWEMIGEKEAAPVLGDMATA